MAIKVSKSKEKKSTTAKTEVKKSVSNASAIREALKAKHKTAIRTNEEDLNLARVPTGVLSIDLVLGGGAPKGRIIEVYGNESTGKSAIASLIGGSYQRKGSSLGYTDVEQAWNADYARCFGVNFDETVFAQPECGEEALQIANDMIDAGIGVMVYDSVGATQTRAELEGTMDDKTMGGSAKILNQGLKKMITKANRQQASAVFINQLRTQFGVMWGNPETTTGGKSLKYFASIRMMISSKFIKVGDERVGITQTIRLDKQKTSKFYKNVSVDINWDYGYDNLKDLIAIASEYGIIKKGGAWYEFNGLKVQGSEALENRLMGTPEVATELYETTVKKLIELKKLPANYDLEHAKSLFEDHLERRLQALGTKAPSNTAKTSTEAVETEAEETDLAETPVA